MTSTKLVTIVPPVAKAAKNLIMTNSENHGENAAIVPETACKITAPTNGNFRPNLQNK